MTKVNNVSFGAAVCVKLSPKNYNMPKQQVLKYVTDVANAIDKEGTDCFTLLDSPIRGYVVANGNEKKFLQEALIMKLAAIICIRACKLKKMQLSGQNKMS